jgi:hypothetical protein
MMTAYDDTKRQRSEGMNYWTDILRGKTQDFVDGLKCGIHEYAVWNDGVEIVGCGSKTKKEVFAEIGAAWADENDMRK